MGDHWVHEVLRALEMVQANQVPLALKLPVAERYPKLHSFLSGLMFDQQREAEELQRVHGLLVAREVELHAAQVQLAEIEARGAQLVERNLELDARLSSARCLNRICAEMP